MQIRDSGIIAGEGERDFVFVDIPTRISRQSSFAYGIGLNPELACKKVEHSTGHISPFLHKSRA